MTRMSEIPVELLNEMTPAVRAFVQTLCARIQEQDRIIASQQKRIEDLERRLGMNSGNSSMPPSSDGPGQQPMKPTKAKSGKKRGGQHGHAKRTRPLIPTKDCDRVETHRPSVCGDCGTKLSGDDPNPVRHQVTEIPAVSPIVTEYQIHTLECPECGCRCRGQLPQQVPRGSFGPNVAATVTLLSSFGRLSQRMIATLLKDLFDLEISDGQISRLQSIGRKAMQAGCDEIAADVRNSAAVNIDETGWRENGRKASLCDESKTAETCRRLSNECFSLFVSVHHEGVSPTNNAAEQALRKAVIFRKLSFGTEKNTGSKNLSVILSVMETCRRRLHP